MDSEGGVGKNGSSNTDKALTVQLLLTTLFASLGSFNFGYNLTVVNAPATTFGDCPTDASIMDCFYINFEDNWGLVPAMLCVGALFGSLIAGHISARLGRRMGVLTANIPYILGLATMALARGYWMLIIGRFLVGIGVGISCIIVPIYLTEISPVASRGLIGSGHQWAIVVGILVAELLSYSGLYKNFYWRILFALDMIPCFIQIIGVLLISPESPRFSAQKGDFDAARNSLSILRGTHFQNEEFEEISRQASSQSASTETWGISELLFSKRHISGKSMLVASALHLGQQLSGINSILFFSSSIFKSAESTGLSVVPILIALLNLLMTFVAIGAIDKTGRRFLALVSSGGMLLSLILLTAAFVMGQKFLSIVFVLLFVSTFAFGMGPVPWLMTNELFPTNAVGPAVSFAVCLNWISNMIVAVTFPKMLSKLGDYAMVPYSFFILIFFIFAATTLPETKGRPLGFL